MSNNNTTSLLDAAVPQGLVARPQQLNRTPGVFNRFKSAVGSALAPPVAGNGTSPSKTFCQLSSAEKKLVTDATSSALKQSLSEEEITVLIGGISEMTQNPANVDKIAQGISLSFKGIRNRTRTSNGGRRKTRTARRKSRKANRKSARTARRKSNRKASRKANRKSRKN